MQKLIAFTTNALRCVMAVGAAAIILCGCDAPDNNAQIRAKYGVSNEPALRNVLHDINETLKRIADALEAKGGKHGR